MQTSSCGVPPQAVQGASRSASSPSPLQKSKIQNPKSKIQNPKSKIQNQKSSIINHQSSIINPPSSLQPPASLFLTPGERTHRDAAVEPWEM
jgi:hypothetical protein